MISWSSLDWTKQDNTKSRWEWSIILGTGFDVVVHAVNAYMLSQYMTAAEMLVGFLLAQMGTMFIIYSPRLAWSSPSSVPKWIEKRVRPINQEDYKSM